MNRRFAPWVLCVVLVTGLCVLVGMVGQQLYRMQANDPQIQTAEDFAHTSFQNQFTDETLRSSFDTFTPVKYQVNIETSLAPWLQVYSETGEPIFSSAVVSDTQYPPHIPKGIFKEVDKHGEVRVTWQPKKNIRQAIVVTKFSGLKTGYIVVGRSLSEVEKHINGLMWLVAGAWIILMIGIGFIALWHFGYLPEFTKTPRR